MARGAALQAIDQRRVEIADAEAGRHGILVESVAGIASISMAWRPRLFGGADNEKGPETGPLVPSQSGSAQPGSCYAALAEAPASLAIAVGAALPPMAIVRGFSASGTTRFSSDMEQAVLQVGTLDHDVVGEHEPTLETRGRRCRDTAPHPDCPRR